MSRHKNDREYLRTVKMTHTVYTMLDAGEFDMHEDDQYYKEKTLAEVIGFERTKRYSSKADDKKRKREFKDTKTKGRCNNKSYKLSESRFKRGGSK